MQGDPLTMVAYGIGVIPLIKRLKLLYPGITEAWYADGAGALGTFDNIGSYLNGLKNNSSRVVGITLNLQRAS